MLAGARLGDDPAPAHALSEEHLPQDVVDLVSPGVIQILALQEYLHAEIRGKALGTIEKGGSAGVFLKEPPEFSDEFGIGHRVPVGGLEFLQSVHQGLGGILTAELTVSSF